MANARRYLCVGSTYSCASAVDVTMKLTQVGIARSLAALAKSCIVRLSEDKVHFIIPGNENKDGVQVWS